MSDGLRIALGKGEDAVVLHAGLVNRHGMIAGATGTGKTVSLQLIAEGLSRLGVPSFVTDVKGDLSGLSQAGAAHPKIDERLAEIGLESFAFESCPTVFRDLLGERARRARAARRGLAPMTRHDATMRPARS